jgi:hypothetical protein
MDARKGPALTGEIAMTERLKQIWAGFTETTTRRLTGKGVDNIVVPHRTDYAAADSEILPEGFEDPATRALAALKEEREARRKMFAGKRNRRARAGEAEAPAPMAAEMFDGGELIKGLKATAMRTERSELDYAAYLASAAGKAVLKKTKKKRFWIF